MADAPLRRPDAALVLVGHGSSKNPDAASATLGLADSIRRRGLFAEVHAAFLRQEPLVRDVMAGLSATEAYVVPNLTCKGYVATQVLPRELGTADTVRLCEPVGSHPAIADMVAARIHAMGLPAPDTAIIVVGHGTARDDASTRQTRVLAESLLGTGVAAEAAAVFLEIPPYVGDWTSIITAPNVIVVPFLMALGLHGAEDIPSMLGIDPGKAGPFALEGRSLTLLPPVGSDPAVADIVLARVADYNSGGAAPVSNR